MISMESPTYRLVTVATMALVATAATLHIYFKFRKPKTVMNKDELPARCEVNIDSIDRKTQDASKDCQSQLEDIECCGIKCLSEKSCFKSDIQLKTKQTQNSESNSTQAESDPRIVKGRQSSFTFYEKRSTENQEKAEECIKQLPIIDDRFTNNSFPILDLTDSRPTEDIIEDSDSTSARDSVLEPSVEKSVPESCGTLNETVDSESRQECSHKWKTLSEDVKSHYRRLSRTDKRRYQKQMNKFQNRRASEQSQSREVNELTTPTNSLATVHKRSLPNLLLVNGDSSIGNADDSAKKNESAFEIGLPSCVSSKIFHSRCDRTAAETALEPTSQGLDNGISKNCQQALADNQINANGPEMETNLKSETTVEYSDYILDCASSPATFTIPSIGSRVFRDTQCANTELQALTTAIQALTDNCLFTDEVSLQLSPVSSPEVYEDCLTELRQPEAGDVMSVEQPICAQSSVSEPLSQAQSPTSDTIIRRPLSREEEDSVDDVAFDIFCDDEMPKVRNQMSSFEQILDELIVRWDSLDSDSANCPKKRVSYCRCWKSKTFPLCDGAHKAHNQENGDKTGPLRLVWNENSSMPTLDTELPDSNDTANDVSSGGSSSVLDREMRLDTSIISERELDIKSFGSDSPLLDSPDMGNFDVLLKTGEPPSDSTTDDNLGSIEVIDAPEEKHGKKRSFEQENS